MPDDINQQIAAWEALVDRYILSRDRVATGHPNMHLRDVRLALYGIPGNVLVTGLLNIKMLKSCLLNRSWWDENIKNNGELEKRQHQTDEFVTHSRVSIYLLVFSFYEATLRALLRAVRPGACDNALAAFATVYTALLTDLGLRQHIGFLDFARTLRNLIHNNGTYFKRRLTKSWLSMELSICFSTAKRSTLPTPTYCFRSMIVYWISRMN